MDEALSLNPINNYSHPEVRTCCAASIIKSRHFGFSVEALAPSVTLAVQLASTMFLLGSRHTDGNKSESEVSLKSVLSSELQVTYAQGIEYSIVKFTAGIRI